MSATGTPIYTSIWRRSPASTSPYLWQNIALAVTKISLTRLTLLTAVSALPGAAIYSLLGAGHDHGKAHHDDHEIPVPVGARDQALEPRPLRNRLLHAGKHMAH
jgi:hypothetical protein